MKVEHCALQVPDPVSMAGWYVKYLGCSVARTGGEPSHARFLRDDSGAVMLEFYRNPAFPIPDYARMSPVLLHVAFVSSDLIADRDRLVKGGASLVEDVSTSPGGDQFAMLRDPWGIPIQLVKRAQPMV